MKSQKKPTKSNCTGESLFNKRNMGGHVDDYAPDPNDKTRYPANLKWVTVGQTFKKT